MKLSELEEDIDLNMKISIVGETSVGKTNLIKRYVLNDFE